MKKKLEDLKSERNALVDRQCNVLQELVQTCVDPVLGSRLALELVDNAGRHRELIREIDIATEKSKQSWWDRLF